MTVYARQAKMTGDFSRFFLRNFVTASVAASAVVAIWVVMPEHETANHADKLTLRAEPRLPVSDVRATEGDQAAAAQMEQFALAKLSPMVPETIVSPRPAPAPSAEAPKTIVTKPSKVAARIEALPVPQARPTLPVLAPAPANPPLVTASAGLLPPAPIPPVVLTPVPEARPGLMARMGNVIPPKQVVKDKIAATAYFIGSWVPKIGW